MRDDFSAKTIRILANRVNSICSNPTCRAATRGPKMQGDAAVNLGKAAHITAASSNGPRFDPSLTPEDRKHFNNGIWLCPLCADLIDADPQRFTVDLLREWKRDAETNALIELGKPRGFSKGRLAVVSAAVPFGSDTNVLVEKYGYVSMGRIPDPKNGEFVPTYFESFACVRKFKIKKRSTAGYVVLDEIRAIVHGCIAIPPYQPLYGAYPAETSLFSIMLRPPVEGNVITCTAERFYEVTEPQHCKEMRFNSIVVDDDVPHICMVRFNAEKPGLYFVSLRVVLSRGMKQEIHSVMGVTPMIFENEPACDE